MEAVVPKTVFIDRPALRSVENCFDCSIEFGEKCFASADAALAIPIQRSTRLSARVGVNIERLICHRAGANVALLLLPLHGMAFTAPESSSAARRLISRRHSS